MEHRGILHTLLFTGTLFLCSLCLGILTVRAETTTVPQADAPIRDNIETRQEVRSERRNALSRAIQDRIINLALNTTNRLTSAINRLQNITDRLSSRITILREQGVDTGTAETKLAESKTTLEQARATLNSLNTIAAVIRGDTPRESFSEIRVKFFETRDALIQTRTLLLDTVALLRGAVRTTPDTQGVSDAVQNADTASTSNTQ